MINLHAQPYDVSARGFYFSRASEYATAAASNHNDCGAVVEEYEIQFIDGEDIDCALAKAWQLNQASFAAFLEAVENWDHDDKLRYIIAVGECGYAHDQVGDDPSAIDITLYEGCSMRELAEQFVDEGLFGEISERLATYLDYDAIARDLAMDHSKITIGGTNVIYHCG